jgi:EAL domain-containing protein (putative c-di-GMP-specific phosphodiesterase class I)
MLVNDVNDIISKMTALKAAGIRISLDDFGTGYSSLTYLKKLPLDQLKVDQSFVREMLSSSQDEAIVRTVVSLAQHMELEVIAEGVETEEQRQFLQSIGCFSIQGYLLSRPLSIQDFNAFLLRSRMPHPIVNNTVAIPHEPYMG